MKRDYSFDNMKVLLITLVVFGHALEEFGTTGKLGLIRAVIYSFHMPLFIFISGYFSKSDAKPEKLLKTTIIPFIIFNTIWMFTQGTAINKIKTVSFFSYFILGYKFKKESIEKIRKIPKIYSLVLLIVAFAVTVYLNIRGIMPVKMYELIQSYSATKLDNMQGMVLRGTIYIIATIIIFALVNLMPDKEFPVTIYGQRTLCIYVLSSFVIIPIHRLMTNVGITIEEMPLQIIVALGITALTFIVTGNKYVNKGYNTLMEKISSYLIKAK